MAEAEMETQFCNNCKKQINSGNFLMHEMHCRRHISLCEHCNEPIPKGEMDVHFEECHAKIKCPKCSVEVEKLHLEHHEENDCEKRPMTCCYCELHFPRNEFDAHVDYCGSRTESCPKCGQYIKLKDQVKHADSKCRFPEVAKPINNSQTDVPYMNADNNEYLTGLPGINPFAFDEMQRVFNRHVGSSAFQNVPAVATRNVGQQRKGESNAVRPKKTVNVKSDVNKKRATAAGASEISRDKTSEYDRILAMHLAEDLNQDNGLQEAIRELEKPTSPISPTAYNGHQGFNMIPHPEDAVLIPCEFCGQQFPMDDLVQHQSGCSLDRISGMLPQMGTFNNNRTDAIGTAGQNRMRSPIQEPLGLINNLTPFDADQWLDDTATSGDETMCLPCEFCDEPFPVDTLVQHQALCDRNTTMTPRVMSPAEPRPKPKKKSALSPSLRLASDFPNLHSRRHQPPPTILADLSDDNDDTVRPVNVSTGAVHKIRKPNTSAANGKSKNTVTPQGNTRSTLSKYGVESPDRGDYFSGLSRPTSENDREINSSSRASRNKKDTSDRTRSTLDDLLTDRDQGSAHDLLGYIGTRRDDQGPIRGKGVRQSTVQTSNNRVPGTRSKPSGAVTSNTGDAYRSSRNTTEQKSRVGKPSFQVRVRPSEADELSDTVLSQRRPARNRANVFGGAGSRPSVTRKRTEQS